MLVDSNILIYCQEVENIALRKWVKATCPTLSAITQVEDIGFTALILNPLESLGT